jgi:hypothetical protein
MGRHSAPDDDEAERPGAASSTVDVAPRRGRHAIPDDAAASANAYPAAAGRQAGGAAPPVARGNQSTADDLELLRAHSDVRARVIAAVVAPFVLYTVAIYLVGAFGVYLLWAWIPLVTAGVFAGSLLDAAHRKRGRR